MLDYAVDEEWIEINPCQRIKYSLKFFSNEEFEPKYLGLKSIIRLLNKTMLSQDLEVGSDQDGFLWAFVTGIVFAVFYALRRGEIYGLRWADIDMHYAHDDGLTVKLIAGEQMNNIFVLEPKTKMKRLLQWMHSYTILN